MEVRCEYKVRMFNLNHSADTHTYLCSSDIERNSIFNPSIPYLIQFIPDIVIHTVILSYYLRKLLKIHFRDMSTFNIFFPSQLIVKL